MPTQPEVNTGTVIKIIGGVIVLILVLSLAFGSIIAIAAGHRGVLLTWGKVEDKILPEGVSFVTPYVNQVVPISVQTSVFTATASSASADLQDVTTEVTLNYHLDSLTVNKIYQNLGLEWERRVIQPAIQEAVKASTASYTAEELITKRPLVKDSIDTSLKEKLSPYGITVETVYITNFKFSDQFTQAIESKVTAVQLAQKAENDLARIKIEAQQIIETAKGSAESIRIQGQALRDNPALVSLKWTEKWDGILPNTLIVGGNTPTLLLPINPTNPTNSSI
jgi:regulator of protease activity HflC (stomatin/prohibitin superfamily)